jgi:pantoate kinase
LAKGYKKRIYKRLVIDPGVEVRVYHVKYAKSEKNEFFMVTLNTKGWEIPLGAGYTPWGAVALATVSPYARNSPKLLRALGVLEQIII